MQQRPVSNAASPWLSSLQSSLFATPKEESGIWSWSFKEEEAKEKEEDGELERVRRRGMVMEGRRKKGRKEGLKGEKIEKEEGEQGRGI